MLKLNKEESFFDLLDKQADTAVRSAETFLKMVDDLKAVHSYAELLQVIETEGDEVTHRLQNKLSGTFITPLDHEDLSEMSHLLDDITDCIEAVAARMEMYRLSESRPDLNPFVKNLLEVVKMTASAVKELSTQFSRSSTLPTKLVQVHTLENMSDQLYRTALTKLFAEETDPITLIKWKEVYDRVEHANDRCESVANLIDNMIVKYA